MNQPKNTRKALLPLSVSKAACAGDSGAVECVLRYYDDYMKQSFVPETLYDKAGYPHVCVDEYMKRRMEIRLIQAMMKP